jgi:hypothetical protein
MTNLLEPVPTIKSANKTPHSLAELLARLSKDDPDACTANDPQFLYRGQASRHFRAWPPRSEHGLARHQFQFDSMIPTDYRGLEGAIEQKSSHTLLLDSYNDDVAFARLCKTWTALVQLGTSNRESAAAVDAWAKNYLGQPVHVWCDMSGSIGQHYGLRTGFLDASSNWRVGLFFASFDFRSDVVMEGNTATLYRIDRKLLLKAEAAANFCDNRTGAFAFRHVDIRDIPVQIAQRPSLQHGWSLINFESPLLLAYLLHFDGIVAFEFTTGNDACIPMREEVMPSNDPLLSVFESFESDDKWIIQCQEFMNQLCSWRGFAAKVTVKELQQNSKL